MPNWKERSSLASLLFPLPDFCLSPPRENHLSLFPPVILDVHVHVAPSRRYRFPLVSFQFSQRWRSLWSGGDGGDHDLAGDGPTGDTCGGGRRFFCRLKGRIADGRGELQRKRLRIRTVGRGRYLCPPFLPPSILSTPLPPPDFLPRLVFFLSPHLSTNLARARLAHTPRFACKCVAKFGSKLLGQDTNPPSPQGSI